MLTTGELKSELQEDENKNLKGDIPAEGFINRLGVSENFKKRLDNRHNSMGSQCRS